MRTILHSACAHAGRLHLSISTRSTLSPGRPQADERRATRSRRRFGAPGSGLLPSRAADERTWPRLRDAVGSRLLATWGSSSRSTRAPTREIGSCIEGEEKYLGFLFDRAHEVREPGLGDTVSSSHGRLFAHAGIEELICPSLGHPRLCPMGVVVEDIVAPSRISRLDQDREIRELLGLKWVSFCRSNNDKPDFTLLRLQTSTSTLPIPIVWAGTRSHQSWSGSPTFKELQVPGQGYHGKGGLFWWRICCCWNSYNTPLISSWRCAKGRSRQRASSPTG